MKEFYITNDGIRLHAKLDMPEGKEKCPLVIIFHGFTGYMEERHIIAVQEAVNEIGFASLRIDNYGHGESEGEFRDHTLYKWVTCGLAVIDYARNLDFVTDLYLTGHSQGGLLTMLLAGMRPDDFKAILPLSPAWMIPEKAREGEVLGVTFDPVHIPEEIQMPGEMTNGPAALGGNYIRVAQTIHVEDEIVRYPGPVLIVHGDADEAVPVEYAYKADELYKNCKLVIVPGDTHCYDNHLEMVTDAVKEFLKEM